MTAGDPARAVYDLVVKHLAHENDGLALKDAGLHELAKTLADLEGEARLDGLVGVSLAIEFVQSQQAGAPALATLTGVLFTVIEKTQLSDAERDAFARRLKSVTGSDTATKILGGARPEGTIPAGPGARFVAQKKNKS